MLALVKEAGGDPEGVVLYPSVRAFNEQHVEPTAEQVAQEFLTTNDESIKREIEDAVEWLPIDIDETWEFRTDVEGATLASFEPVALTLERADETPDGFFMTVSATGDGRLDLAVWKYDAAHLPDDGPIRVYDFDFNESMAAAEAVMLLTLTVSIRVAKGNFTVTVSNIRPEPE